MRASGPAPSFPAADRPSTLETLAMTTGTRKRHYHPIQKDYVTFLTTTAESSGGLTLVEVELAPGGGNGLHYHESYAEHFEVLRGTLSVQVGKQIHVLGPGDRAVARPGELHRFFNASQEDVVFLVELRPGHRGFEHGLQIVYGMAAAGELSKQGMPKSIYQLALILDLTETYLAGPLRLLRPIARLLAGRARRKGIEQELIARYCQGSRNANAG
jgi:quercetin dioxygenase-like cupin family protein